MMHRDRLASLLSDPDTIALIDCLEAGGEHARIVGGAVRNALLGLSFADLDIATTLPPDEVMARVQRAGWHPVPTGIEHGTVTVVIGGRPIEVTTLREDIDTDGRRAVVRFGRDFRADALRRDFTINALSVDRSGVLHDYTGGVEDLGERRIRFIGDPQARIREDYLRILRFFRFHAAYGTDMPDADGLAACVALRDGLDRLSGERLNREIAKLLVAPGAVPTVDIMAQSGIMPHLGLPRADVAAVAAMAAFDVTHGQQPDWVLRLAVLAIRSAAEIPPVAERLRLSNRDQDRLTAPLRFDDGHVVLDERGARKQLCHLGKQAFLDATRAFAALHPDHPAPAGLLGLPDRWEAPVFPFGGAHLLAMGHAPGPAIGRILERARAAWVDAGFPREEDMLKHLLAAAVAEETTEGSGR